MSTVDDAVKAISLESMAELLVSIAAIRRGDADGNHATELWRLPAEIARDQAVEQETWERAERLEADAARIRERVAAELAEAEAWPSTLSAQGYRAAMRVVLAVIDGGAA